MSAHKKTGGQACHNVSLDDETFERIKSKQKGGETKGETVKRLISGGK